jgi:hypothetical protein
MKIGVVGCGLVGSTLGLRAGDEWRGARDLDSTEREGLRRSANVLREATPSLNLS